MIRLCRKRQGLFGSVVLKEYDLIIVIMNSSAQDDESNVQKGHEEALSKAKLDAKKADACLILIRGKPQGKRYFIDRPEMYVGSDSSADIHVEDQTMSVKHAKLTKLNEAIFVSDCGSSWNGPPFDRTLL